MKILKAKLATIILFILSLLIWWDLQPYFKYKDLHSRMSSLVQVGMNIDEARDILEKKGFSPGAKYHPTANKNYYWVDIPLVHRCPISIIPLRALRLVDFHFYGCLEAGLDNKIRKIM